MLARFAAIFQSASSPVRDSLQPPEQPKVPAGQAVSQVPAAQKVLGQDSPESKASQVRRQDSPAQARRMESQQPPAGEIAEDALHEHVQAACSDWNIDTKQLTGDLRPLHFHENALAQPPTARADVGVAPNSVYEFQGNFGKQQQFLFTSLWRHSGHPPNASGITHTFAAHAYDKLIRQNAPAPPPGIRRQVTEKPAVVALEVPKEGVRLGLGMLRKPVESAASAAKSNPELFSDPEVVRRIVYLQLFDHLIGENRATSNFLVDTQTGQVTTIDNQGTFGAETTRANGRGIKFPPMVHKEDAEAILSVVEGDLDKLGLTSKAELRAAKDRLEHLQTWLRFDANVIDEQNWARTINDQTSGWKNGKTPPFTAWNSYIGKLKFPI